MLLTLLLVRAAFVAAASPVTPTNVIPLTKPGDISSASTISILSFPSKPYALSSVRVPYVSRLPTLPKISVTVGASTLPRASTTPLASTSASSIPQAPTLLRQLSLTRVSSPVDVRVVPHVGTPRIASAPKSSSAKNRKPPPVARLSNGILPKKPPLFGYDSSDLDYQQQIKQARDLKRMSTQNTNLIQKNKILLKELKQVLQENNEDYLESNRPVAILSGRRNMDHRRRPHHRKRGRHRDWDAPWSEEREYWSGATTARSPAPGAERPPAPPLHPHRPHHPHRRSPPWELSSVSLLTVSLSPNLPEMTRKRADAKQQVTTTPRGETKEKRNLKRFMAFVKKNRDLLKAFIAQKKAGRLGAGVAGGLAAAGVGAAGARYRAGRTRSEAFLRGLMGDVLHATRVYLPYQLDLAPGRGARIEKLRVKGRICQRHVMKPEGPKYDSRGSTYMPEFVDKPLKHYDVTKKKGFILPNCCNCCRKSVLGCE